jgi:hypothetical protein
MEHQIPGGRQARVSTIWPHTIIAWRCSQFNSVNTGPRTGHHRSMANSQCCAACVHHHRHLALRTTSGPGHRSGPVRSCQVTGHLQQGQGPLYIISVAVAQGPSFLPPTHTPHTRNKAIAIEQRYAGMCYVRCCLVLFSVQHCVDCHGIAWQPPPTTLPGGTRLTFCLRPTDIAIDACSDCLPPRRACLRLPRCPAGRPFGCRANFIMFFFIVDCCARTTITHDRNAPHAAQASLHPPTC